MRRQIGASILLGILYVLGMTRVLFTRCRRWLLVMPFVVLLTVPVRAAEVLNSAQDAIAVMRNLLNESDAAVWTDTQLLDYLNIAGSQVASELLAYETMDTIATASGDQHYALNTDFTRIKGVFYETADGGDWKALRYLDPWNWNSLSSASSGQKPGWFSTWGKQLFIDPPAPQANDSMFVLYYAVPPTLTTSDGDSLMVINDEFRPLVVLYATALAFFDDRDLPLSTHLYNVYVDQLVRKYNQIVNRFSDPLSPVTTTQQQLDEAQYLRQRMSGAGSQ